MCTLYNKSAENTVADRDSSVRDTRLIYSESNRRSSILRELSVHERDTRMIDDTGSRKRRRKSLDELINWRIS